MYGAIIIEPRNGESARSDRDYIVQFSDWTDEDPMRIFAKLKTQSDYYNFNQPTVGDFLRDVAAYGMETALEMRKMWNQMRMNPTDLADISGYSYTYLTNGMPPAANWTGIFRPGEKVRLRFINSGAMTFFDVRIPGLKMTVIQADGQDVEPVTVDEIRIGVAETYDVIVTPVDEAYTIFAQSMDRTGYARATLAIQNGMTAVVPDLDTPVPLTMSDMMGAMSDSNMQLNGMVMDHSAHDMRSTFKVRHARTEYGPSVDMRVDTPRTNLDDPGIGLRNNGRKVLTYTDLHTLGGPLIAREAEREIELHLTGNMERYTWSFDGLEFGKSTPVHFRYGEQLRVILVNDTMMTHPMHLHGMWGELENPDGQFQVRKHVINVQPAQRISFVVPVDARGRWAWHCHLLYHLDAGMFREVVVD
jgi:CopA family copper-resistance protein